MRSGDKVGDRWPDRGNKLNHFNRDRPPRTIAGPLLRELGSALGGMAGRFDRGRREPSGSGCDRLNPESRRKCGRTWVKNRRARRQGAGIL